MKIESLLDIADGQSIQSFVKWRMTYACNYKCSYCTQLQCNKQGANLSKDIQKCQEVAPEVNRIIDQLPGNVKLELIGGEVSLLPLINILQLIPSTKLKKIHMVSNFSQSLEYYEELFDYLYSRDINIEVVFSYHHEYISLEKFIVKVLELRKWVGTRNIVVLTEMPCIQDNSDLCRQFQQQCERHNIYYSIDKDVRPYRLSNDMFSASTWPHKRFQAIYGDGTSEIIERRNDLLNRISRRHRLPVGPEYFCTRDVNFVYIYGDVVAGNTDGSSCKGVIPIKEYSPHKELTHCVYAECTFCGRMSISKNPQVLLQYLQKYTVIDNSK